MPGPRFSLRSLFVVTAVVSLVVAARSLILEGLQTTYLMLLMSPSHPMSVLGLPVMLWLAAMATMREHPKAARSLVVAGALSWILLGLGANTLAEMMRK